ncbi:coiled-coil domain-containing protein 172 isoform X2 [Cynoglossus semilaevis]|uniref:Coiled-coil domain-containing protein 172 n=1 Tax=Cynoglossus semilaevis TaxID=244447 RepID=A0A3P8WQ63_CYNSE|nr:coiled-coil domain-containing protein 172 isoform X2 [Cynoglossus semilaevis]
MSLDKLYQQILLTEQQLAEQTHKLKEVKVEIIKCNKNITDTTDKYEKTKAELHNKVEHLAVKRMHHDLKKKQEDQLLKQVEELLCQKNHLGNQLVKIKTESKEEEKSFFQEISRFNSDFSLQQNRETDIERQTRSEMLELEQEEESLNKEMELMRCGSSRMSLLLEEKRVLQLELQALENRQKDLDRQLSMSESMTQSLTAENLFVSQKPLTDTTCLRLRSELEVYKNGDLEILQDALSSEIQLMQSKLDSSLERKQI